MRRLRFGFVLMVGAVALSSCANDLRLSADVDYRGTTCSGLGREFGRYLNSEILHIQKTGEPRYVVTEREGLPVIRDILDKVDDPTPANSDSLIFHAPAGLLVELGKVIRARDLACTAEQLAAASDAQVSKEVKATLFEDLPPPAADPQTAAGWDQWWRVYGGIAVSAPAAPPRTDGSRP